MEGAVPVLGKLFGSLADPNAAVCPARTGNRALSVGRQYSLRFVAEFAATAIADGT